jgi:hypothetical protein
MDVMNDYWEGLVERAIAGDLEDARKVLEEFAHCVEDAVTLRRPELIPLPIAKYVSDALRQVLIGANPAKALNLVGKSRGRRRGMSVTHNLDALAAAFTLLARRGLKTEEANRALHELTGADRTTIHRARRKNPVFEEWVRAEDGAIKAFVRDDALKVTAAPLVQGGLRPILENRRTKSR